MVTTAYRHPGQLNKPATPTACRRCRHPVLAATVGGFDIRTDPWAHTAAGELRARASGRAVFNAHIDDRRIDLTFRFARHITYAPHLPVLAEHKCGQPQLPVDHAKTAEILAALLDSPTIEGDGECPF